MVREKSGMYDFADESWNQRQQERPLAEVVKEPVQNSMDTGSDIEISIRYDDNSIIVEDYDSEGVRDISNFTTVFQGTKSGDPNTRGRFGRGLKELVGASEVTLAQSTGGTVKWDQSDDEAPRKEYEEVRREEGTMIYASNPDWGEKDLDQVKYFLEDVVPEQDMQIRLEDDRSYKEVLEYDQPDRVYESVLEAANGEELETEVEVRRSEEGQGGIFEMGIPVTTDEDFPYSFNIQQTVPMAEQRQSVSKGYRGEVLNSLIENELDFIRFEELRQEYITDNLRKGGEMDPQVEQSFLERFFKQPFDYLALSTTSAIDDKVDQAGYQVINPEEDNLSRGVMHLVNDHVPTSAEVVEEMERGDTLDKSIEPSEAQRRWLEFVENNIVDPIWDWARNSEGEFDPHDHGTRENGELSRTLDKDTNHSTPMDMKPKPDVDVAYLENPDRSDRFAWYDGVDHAIYFNVAEAEDDWEDVWFDQFFDQSEQHKFNIPKYQRIGVAVHEAAHAESDSMEHDNEWINTNDLMTGKLIQKLMVENRQLRTDEKLDGEPPVGNPPGKNLE